MLKIKNMNYQMIYFALSVLRLLVKSGIFGSATLDSSHFEERLRTRLRTRGGLDTIQWLKAIRLSVYTYLAGKVVTHSYFSTYEDGLPKALGPLVGVLRDRDIGGIRYILTL